MLTYPLDYVKKAYQLALSYETYLHTSPNRKSTFKVVEHPKKQSENSVTTIVPKNVNDKNHKW